MSNKKDKTPEYQAKLNAITVSKKEELASNIDDAVTTYKKAIEKEFREKLGKEIEDAHKVLDDCGILRRKIVDESIPEITAPITLAERIKMYIRKR